MTNPTPETLADFATDTRQQFEADLDGGGDIAYKHLDENLRRGEIDFYAQGAHEIAPGKYGSGYVKMFHRKSGIEAYATVANIYPTHAKAIIDCLYQIRRAAGRRWNIEKQQYIGKPILL